MDFLVSEVWWFTWIVLPLLIFFARILDVSIGTVRLIFVSKGMKAIAPIIGFFEVIIWLIAVAQIMQHLDNWLCYVAYGAGFAAGNYIGMLLEERLALGNVLIRVFITNENQSLIDKIIEANFGVTMIDAEGSKGKLKIVFSIIRRKEISNFITICKNFHPDTFYTIEEVKSVSSGIFRPKSESNTSIKIAPPAKKK